MTTTAPVSARTVRALRSEEIAERARQLRREADRLDMEAAFARGEITTLAPSWQEVIHDGWEHPELAAPSTAQGLAASAVAHALNGEPARAQQLAAQAVCELSADLGVSIGAALARAIAWLDQGDCSAAYEILASQFAGHRRTDAAHYLIAITGVFAEAASRVHEVEAARTILNYWRPLFVEAPEEARREFELASALLGESDPRQSLEDLIGDGMARPSFTTARLHLALGMLLRRHRRTRESRPHLMVAADLLARSGARPWLPIVASELRAAGVRQDAEQTEGELSPQEATIVRLAAQGLSNRQIGERLFLSPRTVGSHLYRIFPKLGITSRHQLHRRTD